MLTTKRPSFSLKDCEEIALELYGVKAKASALASERDQNVKLETFSEVPAGECYVLKIAHPDERENTLEFENEVLLHLHEHATNRVYPELIPSLSGATLNSLNDEQGTRHLVRLISFIGGTAFADISSPNADLLTHTGQAVGEMNRLLGNFRHAAMNRFLQWDAKHAPITIDNNLELIKDSGKRARVAHFLTRFETEAVPHLDELRLSVIHNDLNDHNLLSSGDKLTGIVDFGDMVYSYTVNDLAILLTYAMLRDDPLGVVTPLIRGYQSVYPLTETELRLLPHFILLRLCLSVSISAKQQKLEPNNPYLSVSEKHAWDLLEWFANVPLETVSKTFLDAADSAELPQAVGGKSKADLLESRARHLGYNLSISYRQNPLKIVRGKAQYLFDETGRQFLDCVNNVCHVGHSHPRVVAAASSQMQVLNTNTRYLHDNIVQLAERLTATLPERLSVCYFVNSGSEANDLALRMARAHTGAQDVIVVDHAYHGHTGAVIEISPYKFNGKGGAGRRGHVHVAPMPDALRGKHKAAEDLGAAYAEDVGSLLGQLQLDNRNVAAFVAESVLGCGGQIVLPAGYLHKSFKRVRAAGGVCISDEVQVGFGRVGTHMWGFESQDFEGQRVTPDIVTMGKPMGNGHPLAAVVTTPDIAASFAKGPEYFNTFGGNPVSCAVGLAVLDVIKKEGLQQNALRVGRYFKDELEQLRSEHPLIADVRGLGLFLGVELVEDLETLEPATRRANEVVMRMRERGVLLSSDGPFDNVIKIKPPLVFTKHNVDEVISRLDEVLTRVA